MAKKITDLENQIRIARGQPAFLPEKCCMLGCQKCTANLGLKKRNKSLATKCQSNLNSNPASENPPNPPNLLVYLKTPQQ